jgi:hypothetical protein
MICKINSMLAGLSFLGYIVPMRAAAQNTFEGVIAFKMVGEDGKTDTMTQTTKGNSLKLEGMGKGNGSVVFDAGKHRMLMIQPDEKQYVVATEEDMKQMSMMTDAAMQKWSKKRSTSDGDDDVKLDFGPTGRTETVAGVKCEVWHGTSIRNGEKHEGEACLAKGVGFAAFNVMENPMLARHGKEGAFLEQYRKLVGPGKGVIKMVEFKEGKPHSSMEAIKVQPMAITQSAFEPPAGYKEIDMHDQLVRMQGAMQKMQAGQK